MQSLPMSRQGDVLLISCEEPIGAEKQEAQGDRIILAHGEATGHAHTIARDCAAIYALAGLMYLKVFQRALLRHEEHGEVIVEPGWYRLPGQRQYTPEEVKRVAD